MIRIHVTMVINNPGNVITEQNTWYNCDKQSGLGDCSKSIMVAIEEPHKCAIKHKHVAK